MTGPFSLGRQVWSLPHVRSAILELLETKQLVELLTLNYESFPQVVEALYSDLDERKWRAFFLSGKTQLVYPCLDRLLLYRRNVRSIDITGTLPACVMFTGGIDGLLKAFPRLKRLKWLYLECTLNRSACDVTFHATVRVYPSEIKCYPDFIGYYSNLPSTFKTLGGRRANFKYELEVYSGGLYFEMSLIHVGTSLLQALRNTHSGHDLGPLFDASDDQLAFLWDNITSLSTADLLSTSEALTFVQYSSRSKVRKLCFESQPTVMGIESVLEQFQAPYFPSLEELELELSFEIDDWPQAKGLDRVWRDTGHIKPLHLKRFKIDLSISSACGINGVAAYWESRDDQHWYIHYLPDVELMAKRFFAIGGPACAYAVDVQLCYESHEWSRNQDNLCNSAMIYKYLLHQALDRLQHDDAPSIYDKSRVEFSKPRVVL